MHDLKLGGKIAVVTGGASGIGESVSFALAREGAKIVVADLSEENAGNVVNAIKDSGGEAYAVQVDVSSRASVKKLFEAVVEKYGTVDILVTAAGIAVSVKFEDVTEEDWQKILGVNLIGTFFCIQEAVAIMKQHDGNGKIVTISSDTGKRGGRGGGGGVPYAASKGGVLALTRTISREMAVYPDFSINCVCPGPTDTPMHKNKTTEHRQTVSKEIPKGRFAKSEEIANGVLFLVSDLSTFVYGETLNVDGGLLRD